MKGKLDATCEDTFHSSQSGVRRGPEPSQGSHRHHLRGSNGSNVRVPRLKYRIQKCMFRKGPPPPPPPPKKKRGGGMVADEGGWWECGVAELTI